jgi:DNA-binding NarL/FixJ family response regulator
MAVGNDDNGPWARHRSDQRLRGTGPNTSPRADGSGDGMTLTLETPTQSPRSGRTTARVAGAGAHPPVLSERRGLTSLQAATGRGELIALHRVRRFGLRRGAASSTPRLLIAGGDALLRAGLRVLLEANGHVTVAGEAGTGEEAVAAARRISPDVVLLDEDMPGPDCVEVTRRMVSEAKVAVMVLTSSEGDDRMFAALRAGASGLLLKDAEPAELVRAVDALAKGGGVLSPGLTRWVIAELASRPAPAYHSSELLEELSVREREVVALVGLGLSNREIAERLVISPATAKTHVSRAMVKLRVGARAQLVVLAYEAGLVVPGAGARGRARQPAPLAT